VYLDSKIGEFVEGRGKHRDGVTWSGSIRGGHGRISAGGGGFDARGERERGSIVIRACVCCVQTGKDHEVTRVQVCPEQNEKTTGNRHV
jgi:hypothetical protein